MGPQVQLLTFEEIERVVRLAVQWGIQKIRLTGGEPLLRHQAEVLVARIAAIPGVEDLAMTTNGFLFPQKARALRAAGLRRVSFSLDSLDRANFKQDHRAATVWPRSWRAFAWRGIWAFNLVKVNAVIIRGLNDHEIEALADFAREQELSCRFIEFMPLDSARAWQKEMVVPGREILERLQTRFDLRPVEPTTPRPRPNAGASPRARRDRHYRSGERALLRPLQPHPPDRRRQDPHLPVQCDRARSAPALARRGVR